MTVDHDQLVAYALGTLPPERERDIEQYLINNPEAEQEVRGLMDALAQVALELPPAPAAPPSVQDVLTHVRAHGTRAIDGPPPAVPARPAAPGWRRFLPVAAVAAVVAMVAVLVPGSGWYQNWSLQQQVAAYQTRPGAVTKPLTNANGQTVGLLVRLANGQVFVSFPNGPRERRVYQAWQIANGKPTSLGVFAGRSFLSTQAVKEGSIFGVTVEPEGGSDQPTSAPIAIANL